MSLDEVSVALKLKSSDVANLQNVQKALESIEKLDKKIDFKAFAKGVATIDWETVGQEAADSVNKNIDIVGEKIDTVSSSIAQLIQDMAQMSAVLGVPIETLKTSMDAALVKISEAIATFSSRVSTNFSGQTKRLNSITGKVEDVRSELKTSMESITTSIEGMPKPITPDDMAEVVTTIKTTLDEISTNLSSQIKEGGGGGNMEEVAGAFKDTSTSINTLAESFYDFLSEMHSIISMVSGFTPRGGPPPPPAAGAGATGAIVMAPTPPTPPSGEIVTMRPKPGPEEPELLAEWKEEYNELIRQGKNVIVRSSKPTPTPSQAMAETTTPEIKAGVPTPAAAMVSTFEKQKEEWMKRAPTEPAELEIFKGYLERMERRLVDMAKLQKENNEKTERLLQKRETSMASGMKRKEVEKL